MTRGHEVSDVAPGWIAATGLGLALALMLLGAGIYGYRHLFDRNHVLPSLSDIERTQLVPPEPRLEADPEGDARTINSKADKNINSYGWIDQKDGIAHVPIDQAMQMLVQRGWPSAEKQP
jgi:hypothetical protein